MEAQIKSEARKKFKCIQKLIFKILNPEVVSNLAILKVFSDGQAHSWDDLLKKSGLSKMTLSRRLKALMQAGVLKKERKVAFPPRSYYYIDIHYTGVKGSELITKLGKYLFAAEDSALTFLEWGILYNLQTQHDKKATLELAEKTLQHMIYNIQAFIQADLHPMFEEELFVSVRSYCLMLMYLAAVSVLNVQPEVQSETARLLNLILKSPNSVLQEVKEKE